MPKLSISGAPHDLTDEVITIGRAPDNMIVIDDPSVSGRHAQLRLAGEVYRLKDLESTNGTRVNGIPVTETALRFDDRIRFLWRGGRALRAGHARITAVARARGT